MSFITNSGLEKSGKSCTTWTVYGQSAKFLVVPQNFWKCSRILQCRFITGVPQNLAEFAVKIAYQYLVLTNAC